MNKEDYNKEPVHYCVNCLSLAIREVEDIKVSICDDCGNTDIKLTSIDTWNLLYVREYGELFLASEDD
jgi:hypothetical protein